MAGTVTVTREEKKGSNAIAKKIEKVIVDWTSDASGDATATITDLYGWLIKLVTDPTDGPTDNYDITLNDADGADALQGLGANRDTTNSESTYIFASGAPTPVLLCGSHSFAVAAAGNAKSGRAVLYIVDSL